MGIIHGIAYSRRVCITRIRVKFGGAYIEKGIDLTTLNLGSGGKWITAYIGLPEGFDVHKINVSSILLNNTIPLAPSAPVTIGDYNNNGIPDLMVKFDKQAVVNLIIQNYEFTGKTGTVMIRSLSALIVGFGIIISQWRLLSFVHSHSR